MVYMEVSEVIQFVYDTFIYAHEQVCVFSFLCLAPSAQSVQSSTNLLTISLSDSIVGQYNSGMPSIFPNTADNFTSIHF